MQPQSRKPAIVLVTILIGLGLALNLWRPIYLDPPHLGFTWFVYVGLALAWVPVLAIWSVRSSPVQGRVLILLVVIGMVVSAAGFCAGPSFPTGMLGVPLECSILSTNADMIRYECIADRMFLVDVYTFEGLPGWPVVWLVSHTTIQL